MTRVPGQQQRRRGSLANWAGDLVMGVRLAAGAGRASAVRLVLSAAGIGVGVAILLGAAAAPHMAGQVQARDDTQETVPEPRPGVDALKIVDWQTRVQGRGVEGLYVQPTGADAPVPPGVSELPGPGEIVVSPDLAELLRGRGEDAGLLRAQLPQRVTGTIAPDGLTGPRQLYFYAGARLSGPQVASVYAFGSPGGGLAIPPVLLLLVAVGVVVLLVPVLSFTSTAFRIAGPARDRRLAAVRLVGASRAQARRIAAAEALLAALAGLALGAGLFLAGRELVSSVRLGQTGISVYPGDVTPPATLVALIVVLIPALAVGSALAATRATTIEPLAVTRSAAQPRRRLWPRLLPLAAGPAMIVAAGLGDPGSNVALVAVVAGTATSLLGVLAVLPWLVQHAVRRLHPTRPAWQLAVGRLHLDSATPARVVGGLAVVLSGAIALQSVLLGAQTAVGAPTERVPGERGRLAAIVSTSGDLAPELTDRVTSIDGVAGARADRFGREATVLVRAASGADARAVQQRLRAGLVDYHWRAHIVLASAASQTRTQRLYTQIRAALLAAALLPLALAGISLLALAGEQIRERRRPLAVLAATGIPRAVLARSLLWQQLLPTLLAMALATATGTGLGILVTNLLIGEAPHVDWAAITVFTATGILMALSVTLLTLPALRAATHHQALQTE